MSEGGPPGRFAPFPWIARNARSRSRTREPLSPLVLPHAVPGPSPKTVSDSPKEAPCPTNP